MNFEIKTESDFALFAVVIVLIVMAAYYFVLWMVEGKGEDDPPIPTEGFGFGIAYDPEKDEWKSRDVEGDMNDSDLGDKITFKKATPESYEGSKDALYKADEMGHYDIGHDPPKWATHYKTIKSKDMSDQKVIPIIHWKSEKNGDWYWRITSTSNGKILARGSEGYSSEQKCLQGLIATIGEILVASFSGASTEEGKDVMSRLQALKSKVPPTGERISLQELKETSGLNPSISTRVPDPNA